MKHLVLIGLMGAGKTTVGRVCAGRLDRAFVDTDDVVIALGGGAPIEEIFAVGGETRFRELERAAIADITASPAPLVIACGGGAATDAENRRRLRRAGVIVWLQAPVAVLAERVGNGATRPLLAGGPVAALTRLEAAREAAYEAAADITIDTEDRDIEAVAEAVVAAFAGVEP
jgi:shikimate kinase